MQQAARQLGMDEEQGRALAVATFTGAAQLAAQSGEPVERAARTRDVEGRHDGRGACLVRCRAA